MAFFENLISEIVGTGQPSGEVWFRGHADASWPLIPRLLRSSIPSEQEKNMLARFRYRAMGMLDPPPADDDPARWFFLMQHHGLPTRLLDWSESALASLFFAVTEAPDKDGQLYILVPMILNEEYVGQRVLIPPTMSPCREIMLAAFKGTDLPSKIVAISTYASNDRVVRQRGGFTVHGISDDMRNITRKGVLRSVIIPSRCKAELQETLSHFGVTRTTLFHDLDALAWEIREQYGIS